MTKKTYKPGKITIEGNLHVQTAVAARLESKTIKTYTEEALKEKLSQKKSAVVV